MFSAASRYKLLTYLMQAVGEGQGSCPLLQSLHHPSPARGIILIGGLPTMKEWVNAENNGEDVFAMPHLEVGSKTMAANTHIAAASQGNRRKK